MLDLINMDIPEGLFTPEEMARFLKLKSDLIAFNEEHGDHMEWLSQAAELGLIRTEPLTPDELQYLEAAVKVIDEKKEEFKQIEGFEKVKAARVRFKALAHIRKELNWVGELFSRKQAEAGSGILKHINETLEFSIKYSAEHPENDEIKEFIAQMKDLAEQLTTKNTALELRLETLKPYSGN